MCLVGICRWLTQIHLEQPIICCLCLCLCLNMGHPVWVPWWPAELFSVSICRGHPFHFFCVQTGHHQSKTTLPGSKHHLTHTQMGAFVKVGPPQNAGCPYLVFLVKPPKQRFLFVCFLFFFRERHPRPATGSLAQVGRQRRSPKLTGPTGL